MHGKGSPAHANRFANQFLKKLPSRQPIRTSAYPHIKHSPRSPLCIPLSQRPRRMQCEGSPARANRFTNQFVKKLPSRKPIRTSAHPHIRTSAHLQIRTLNIHLARPCAFLSAKGLVGCMGRAALRTPIDLPINS